MNVKSSVYYKYELISNYMVGEIEQDPVYPYGIQNIQHTTTNTFDGLIMRTRVHKSI